MCHLLFLLWRHTHSKSEIVCVRLIDLKSLKIKVHLTTSAFTAGALSSLWWQEKSHVSDHMSTSSGTACLGLSRTLIKCLTLCRGQTAESCGTCRRWHRAALWKCCIISTLLVFPNVTQPRRGQPATGKQASCTSRALNVCQSPLWPPLKVSLEIMINLAEDGRRAVSLYACVRLYFFVCVSYLYAQWAGDWEAPREGIKRNRVYS